MEAGTIKINNKKKVMKATEESLIENGIDKTTIDIISQKAHITARSIYRYYGNRDNLLICFAKDYLQMYHDHIWNDLKNAIDDKNEALKQIEVFLTSHFVFFQEKYKMLTLVEELEIYFSKNSVDIHQDYYKKTMNLKNDFQQLIEKGMNDGSINKAVDSKLLSETIINSYTGLARKISLTYKKSEFIELPNAIEQLKLFNQIIISYLKI